MVISVSEIMFCHISNRVAALVVFLTLLGLETNAQCPSLLDTDGVSTQTPTWFSCNPGAYNLYIQTNSDWAGLTINWGDGSAPEYFNSWIVGTTVSHSYTAAWNVYPLTFTSDLGCVISGEFIKEESVNPSITIPQGWITDACAPATLNFQNSSTNVSTTTTFSWQFDSGITQDFDHTNSGATISHDYLVGTTGCNRPVTLYATNACRQFEFGTGASVTIDYINIWDTDNAIIGASSTQLCYPDTVVSLVNATEMNCTANGNTTQRFEKWNFGDLNNDGIDDIIDWRPWVNSNPIDLALPGIGTYFVTLYDSSFCGIDSTIIELIVRSPLVTNLSGPPDVCEGLSATFVQDNLEATAFYWNFNNGAGQWYPGGAPSMTWTFNNPGSYSVLGVVALEGQTAACHDTARFDIIVKPAPQVLIDLTRIEGCDSFTAVASELAGQGVIYDWTFNIAPGTSTGPTTPILTFDTPGTSVVSLEVTSANGCVRAANEIVTVYESPNANFTSGPVCLGDSTAFIDLSLPVGGDSLINWLWNFGDTFTSTNQHPNHLYNTAGTYDVSLSIATAHCNNLISTTVQVEPQPAILSSSDVLNGCTPMLVNFTASTDPDATLIWEFGDGLGSVTPNISHTYLGSGTVGVTYEAIATATSPFGCTAKDTIFLATLPGAQASFFPSNPTCAPMIATFTNESQAATSYSWDFTDGSNANTEISPIHTFQNTTGFLETFPVQLIAYADNGCHDTTIVGVTVFPQAIFDFTLPAVEGCSPFVVQTPPISGAQDLTWSFGDGSADSNIPMSTHIYTNNSDTVETHQLYVSGVSSFGCVGSFSTVLSVNPQPIADYTVDVQTGCAPLTVTFSDNSVRALNYSWNYGDGGVDTGFGGVAHEYVFNNQNFNSVVREVNLIVEGIGGCTDTQMVSVELYPEVIADFLAPASSCSPSNVVFVNQSLNANGGFTWDFGDGTPTSITAQPTHVYLNNNLSDTTYTVTLDATSVYGCVGTKTDTINVLTTPIADIIISDMTGCYPLTVTFTNGSVGAEIIEWSYGTGEISNETAIDHTYNYFNPSTAPVSYTAILTASTISGCSTQDEVIIEVLPAVNAAFDVPQQGCTPFEVAFLNQSDGATVYNWDFGDGLESNSFEPSHIFTTPSFDSDTTFTVSLIVTSTFGCTDTMRTNIDVLVAPLADFSATPISQTYPNSLVTIANTSSTGLSSSMTWNFGDGNISLENTDTLTHIYDTWGTYTLALNVTNGYCSNNSSQTINIKPPVPEVSFMGGAEGCSPLTVSFTNFSQYADGYRWKFGDGSVGSSEHPTHVYDRPGYYDVSLEVYGYDGTVIESIHYAAVIVYPTAQAAFTLAPTEVFVPGEYVNFMNLSENATEYVWAFGDGTASTLEHPLHQYTYEGEYVVSLTANNEWGCSTTFSFGEAVIAKPGGYMTFPTAFTPLTGGSGGGSYDPEAFDNNIFHPMHAGVLEYNLVVFNKLGEQIFYSTDVNIGWDGYVNGEIARQDVYAYKALAILSDGREIERAGTVTLLSK